MRYTCRISSGFEAVNYILNNICGIDDGSFFGNIPIVLEEDFAQIPLVVERDNWTVIVQACLQYSSLWQHLKRLQLKTIWVRNSIINEGFAAWLGQMMHNTQWLSRISLLPFIQKCGKNEDRYAHIFPLRIIESTNTNYTVFWRRDTLMILNDIVTELNDVVLQEMQCDLHTYYSAYKWMAETFRRLEAYFLQKICRAWISLGSYQLFSNLKWELQLFFSIIYIRSKVFGMAYQWP